MKKKQVIKKNNKTAYSLLELSIVILIIAILISGAMTMSVGTLNNAKNKATQDKIAEIYKSLGNFLLANKRLPCPASLKKLKNAGWSDADIKKLNQQFSIFVKTQ